MKVFIVIGESGYDGESVEAVFLDKEKADKYCEENYCFRVEEHEVQE